MVFFGSVMFGDKLYSITNIACLFSHQIAMIVGSYMRRNVPTDFILNRPEYNAAKTCVLSDDTNVIFFLH